MDNYNFKVVAKLRDDLNQIDRKKALDYINEWQGKFQIMKIDDETYCKSGKINGHDDFGAVSFFFCVLEDKKEYFSKLEYYDLWEGENCIAV